MLQKLTDYFKARGILSTHFRCRHRLSCGAYAEEPKRPDDWRTDVRFAMEDSGEGDSRPCPKCGTPMDRAWNRKKGCERCGYCPKFTGPKSSLVGVKYERSAGFERGGLPRLLFLSPYAHREHWDAKPKTPDQVRRWDEREGPNVRNYGKGDQRKHWYRTYELAWYILRVFRAEFEDIEKVTGHFAHVNAAKCCVNDDANGKLVGNCREFLPEELETLRPDIVVTQGQLCGKTIEHLYEGRIRRIQDKLACVQISDTQQALWFWTYLPSSRRPEKGKPTWFEKQADFDASEIAQGWVRYSRRIRQILEESKDGQIATNRVS